MLPMALPHADGDIEGEPDVDAVAQMVTVSVSRGVEL